MPDAPQSQPLEIPGSWWPVDDPSCVEFGKLRIEATGDALLTLETIKPGALGRAFAERSRVRVAGPTPRTFHGRDQHSNAVTLFGCIQEREHTNSNYSERCLSAALVLRGCHCASLEEVKFAAVEVDFTNLQEWLENPRPNLSDNGAGNITVAFPDSGERLSPSGAGFTVGVQTLREQSFGNDGLRFNCADHLTLRFDERWGFEAIRKLVSDLQWFLTLAMSRPVQVTGMEGYAAVQAPGARPEPPIAIYTRWPGRKSAARQLHGAEMMFTLRSLGDGIGPTLARWRSYREKHSAVLANYFATIFNEHLYQNHILLFLAHALELYHQINYSGAYQTAEEFQKRLDAIVTAFPTEAGWLRERLAGANRKTFADRLRELLASKSKFSPRVISDPDWFVQKVRDTRNYYTHYDSKLLAKGKIAQDQELFDLAAKMRVFLEAAILDDLGLPSAVERVLTRPGAYYVKLL